MAGSYIPARESLMILWMVNFATLIAADPGAYGLTAGDATTIDSAVDAFQTAYTTATNPETRTIATVAAKNGAKAYALGICRPYAIQIRNNSGVSNEQRAALGITIVDTGRTPVPPPVTNPLLSFVGATPLQHTLRFADSNTPSSRAKPAGAKLMFLFRHIGTTAISDPTQAEFYNAVGAQPVPVDFTDADRGKICTYFAQWANPRGQRGPWSPALSAVVI